MKTDHKNIPAKPAQSFNRAIRHSPFVLFLLALCLLWPAQAFGQSSNRWLFVFNTSLSMRDRTKGVADVTVDLLATGMHGNLRTGDTIGIWTFNDKVHAGEVPLQTWSPDVAEPLARYTLQFLAKQRYENAADLDSAMSRALQLVKASDVITVILVSDAGSPIKGTPFDEKLNAFYKENYRKQKKDRMPFVTVFRGNGGILTTNTVTMAPWPVEIPAVPPPQVVVQKPKPVVPSLIVIGKKPATAAPATPLPVASPATITETTSAPIVPVEPIVGSNPAPQMAVMTSNVIQSVSPVVTSISPTPPPAKVEATPAPPVASPEPKPTALPPPVAETKPIAQPIIAPESKPVAATPPSSTAPAPAVAPLPYPDVAPKVETAVSNSALPAETPPGVEATTAVPSQKLFSTRNIVIATIALLVIAGGLLALACRRARRPHVSLITRSLDRKK